MLTPGNGHHIYYAYPGELKSGTLGEGVDFLAEGRMVIAPGSVRAGKSYLFVNGRDLLALAPLPGSVLAKLKRSAGQKKLDTWSEKIKATPEGDRHNVVRDACWALAHEVAAGRLDESEFRNRISDMAGTCVPALDRLDIENSIESALRKARGSSASGTGTTATFTLPDFEPFEDPVGAAELLTGIGKALQAYVSLSGDQIVALSLWIVHTHCLDATDYTPRLLIRSPTKRCGKSTLLRIIGKLVRRPLSLSGVSAAMLFRSIAAFNPTLLLDEADNAGLKHNEDLRAVLNEGVYREAVVGRTVGDDHEPKLFPIFAPAALAGIGAMPATLLDRSTAIDMRRKLKSEKKERFDRRRIDHLTELGSKAARFAADNVAALAAADPEVPEILNDRELDGWRPLLAIADLAGPNWGQRARAAAVNLCGAADDELDDEPALVLLQDCRKIFDETKAKFEDEITSASLMAKLHALEDRPWNEWGRFKKPITANSVARLLKRYDIKPGTLGSGNDRPRGYCWAQFDDAWKRYGGAQ